MRISSFKYEILSLLVALVSIVIFVVPFHAFLTIWASTFFGHYTLLRLWKEALLLISVLGALCLLMIDQKTRREALSSRLVQLVLVYALVNVVWAAVAYNHHSVNAKAVFYGLLLDLRFPAFFLIAWAATLRTKRLREHWQRLVLVPAIIVVVFGLLQALVLPVSFLSHFGYGPYTIGPYETINHNIHYIRIMSTLRGANPLGAYLIIPISFLCVYLTRRGWRWLRTLLLVAALLTLYFSFSRSAWLGAIVSIAVVLVTSIKSKKAQLGVVACGLALVLVALVLVSVNHNTRLQNVILHTQSHSSAKTSSNEGHVTALKAGLHDVVREPLGRGPGTAGPASVYNNHPGRIAENYFVQIGQETGWLGLALFIAITVGVAILLWLQRDDPLALSLFASLIGLIVVNMLSHAWTDDTLAYVWWGLAGIAMVPRDHKMNKELTEAS